MIAAQWLELLLDAESPVTETAVWKRKAAVAFRMAGRDDLADQLGNVEIELDKWGRRLSTTQPKQIDEWPMLFGNSRRFTVGTGSAPVLLKRWSVPTTWNRSLTRKIDDLIDGFTDANRSTLPVAMPLLVNGRMICRTFRGIQVAEAATGKLLWSTDGQDSVESMLSGQLNNPRLKVAWNGNPLAFLQQSSPDNSTGGPLGQLMFQNAAHGLLSCDGERLYVIEDHPVYTLNRTSIRFRNNQSTVALNGNRLKAYDLETGRPLWEAGGPTSIEEFALPLSGHFFMGPPVAEGGDLFVMTESDSEIRLQALDPETGHPKWSQPIAYAERRIDQDLNRRMWSTHLAIADGTVICPTTVGWLVAVDRTRRSVQWAFRYAPRRKATERGRRRFTGSSQVPTEAINTRWLVSAPVVRGDRLLFTPPETTDEQNASTGTLVCIELSTGKRLWQRPKATHLYLAGVLEDRAILVAHDSVKALSLAGKLLWECPFGSDSRPSGRGVTIDGILYQPMQRNELIGIHLTTGKVVSRQKLPFGERPLGNLLTYRGMLISYHPAEVTAWEQKDALNLQLAEIRDQSRDDVDSLLLEAKASAAEDDFDHALSLLDRISAGQPYRQSADVRQRVDHLIRRVIVSRIRRSPGERPELHDRLQQLVWSPREKSENHQLKFVTLSALNQHSEAFGVLMQLVISPGEISFVRADNQQIEAEQDAWLQGQMLDVWERLSAAEQTEISHQMQTLSTEVKTETAQRRLAGLLAFHPATEPLRLRFARSAVESGRLHEATGWLMQSRWTAELPEIASLYARLIEDYQQAGDFLIPIQIATQWRDTLDQQPLSNRQSIEQLLTQTEKPIQPDEAVDASDWGDFDLNLMRTATSYSYRTARTLNPRSGHRTVCDGLRIEWVQQSYGSVTQRINFINESDGSLYWSVPIRSGTSGSPVYRHFHLGTRLIVFSQGVLNCLSIPERRVVWTQLVGAPDKGSSTLKRSFRHMSPGTSFLNEIPGRA
ncbi:MAG: PQQ-binding-like beta-propeller repeat protein, partial [Planctomycetaceae bacterium]